MHSRDVSQIKDAEDPVCWVPCHTLSSGVTRCRPLSGEYNFPPWAYVSTQIVPAENKTGRRPWWRHQINTFSALLALCEGNSPVTGEFPSQRPVTRSFDVFSDLGLNKRLSKQSKRRWFETASCSLWRHCNAITIHPSDTVFKIKLGCL